ncbi:MAG: glycosyltransferase family 39 protein [Candidatus Dormibacter sp.]
MVISGAVVLALQVWLFHAGTRDFDEGVYWQSVRALSRGEPLFRSVFASQPPAFYYTLLPFYLLSHAFGALRLTVLLFALVGLAAGYAAARMLAGPTSGLIALILLLGSPLYIHEAGIVQADMPSVAMMLVAVALAIATTRDGTRGVVPLSALTGAALGLAIGLKFSGAVAAIPVVLLLLTPRRQPVRVLVAAAAGVVVTLLVIFLPALRDPSAAYADLVAGHLLAGQAARAGILANAARLLDRSSLPLLAVGLAGAVIAVRRHDPRTVAPLGWVIGAIAAILIYHPLFPHHLLILPPALALAAAVGFADLAAWRAAWLPGFAAAVLVVSTVGLVRGFRDAQRTFMPNGHDLAVAAAMRAASRPGDFVITDNAYAVGLADRDLPGPLVDASHERIAAGLLTVVDLDAARNNYGVKVLVTDNGRLQSVPGFSDWLHTHFRLVEPIGSHAALYFALEKSGEY